MNIETTLLILMVSANILLLALIPVRKYIKNISIFFTASIITNIFWIVGIILMLNSTTSDVFKIGEVLFILSPLLTALFWFLFSASFHNKRPLGGLVITISTIPALLFTLVYGLGNSPVIDNIEFLPGLNSFSVITLGYVIYSIVLILYFFSSYVVLFNKYRNNTGNIKKQVKYILVAAYLSSFFALVTNILLPLLGNTKYIWLGPIFSLAYILIIPATINRYRLFDTKSTTVKGLSFIASLVTIALLVSILLFLLSNSGLGLDINSASQNYAIIVLILASIILFFPIKSLYDGLTQKLYFKKQLQAQDLLNMVNDTLVKANDPKKVLDDISHLLKDGTSAEICNFYIEPDAKIEYHIAGTNPDMVKSDNWKNLEKILIDNPKNSINIDSDQIDSRTKNIMHTLNIGLIIKMDANNESVGNLILGERTNGETYSRHEIQTLEVVADEVAITLQSLLRFEEIARFNITLQKEINSATKELMSSNEKLKSLDEAKDDFISMASHQLRTPLTSIKGYISMMLEGDTGEINEQQRNFLNQAFISSQRMVFLISDLLNVSRLKTGKFVIDKSDVYLPDIVSTEIDQLESTARARGLKLIYQPPDDYPVLKLDETKTHQVIMNFIDNAIFYSTDGGEINIKLKATGKTASLAVKDMGIGVPKESQHQLFTKFYRAENAKNARPDGTGLGLYMAKKVIIAQGGHIIFESQEGKGSTFGFSFPVN